MSEDGTGDEPFGLMLNGETIVAVPGGESYTAIRDLAIHNKHPLTLISKSGHECDVLPFTGGWIGSIHQGAKA